LEQCEQTYDSFNASQHTLDTHLHNSLQQLQHRLTDDEVCFIQEVGVLATGPGITVGPRAVRVHVLQKAQTETCTLAASRIAGQVLSNCLAERCTAHSMAQFGAWPILSCHQASTHAMRRRSQSS
jgi:hypothetical protein